MALRVATALQRRSGRERDTEEAADRDCPASGYGGQVYCLTEDGVTFVCKVGGQFEVVHSNRLADDDMGMATPAIAGDRLLIRTSARVYCIARGGR